nr:SDR family NAD(P)-dependent oxidoreductase [Eubacterium sp.]
MSQNVLVTGTGKSSALGYNFVLRYLENGDNVIATVREESQALNQLKESYGDQLCIVTMDIASTESVCNAKKVVEEQFDYIDLLINNAVAVSPDFDKEFFQTNLDYIAQAVDISAVGPLRVIQAFYPLLAKSKEMALVINISSEAGSIGKCYRTNMIDYGMAKAALNMGTMNLVNVFKNDEKINIFCVHPGWIRTDGKPDNPAPLSSYEAAEILRKLFEEKRMDKTGPRFITNEGEEYPF